MVPESQDTGRGALYGKKWGREETLAALALYRSIRSTPGEKIEGRNPEIRRVARLLGRSSGALARKLLNLGDCDGESTAPGFEHSSELDRQIWSEYEADPSGVLGEGQWLLAQLEGEEIDPSSVAREPALLLPEGVAEDFPEGREVERLTRVRGNHRVFHDWVLGAHRSTCCMTGIDEPQLLTASHIMSWAAHPGHRVGPRNGLCLNALHDRAFDRGLITVDADYTIRVSGRIHRAARRSRGAGFIAEYDGRRIQLPERYPPNPEFLDHHSRHIFVGSG